MECDVDKQVSGDPLTEEDSGQGGPLLMEMDGDPGLAKSAYEHLSNVTPRQQNYSCGKAKGNTKSLWFNFKSVIQNLNLYGNNVNVRRRKS